MSKKVTFVVLREMQGERDYKVGDQRELTPLEAAHLVDLGVLREATQEEIDAASAAAEGPAPAADAPIAKVEPPLANKVDPPARPKAKRKR